MRAEIVTGQGEYECSGASLAQLQRDIEEWSARQATTKGCMACFDDEEFELERVREICLQDARRLKAQIGKKCPCRPMAERHWYSSTDPMITR